MNRIAYKGVVKPSLLTLSLMMSSQLSAAESAFNLGVIEVVSDRESNELAINGSTLTQQDLQLFDRNDVGSAAKLLSGVNLQKSGARNESLLFVRGFNSRQVPVYIDGIPIYVPYDGNIDLGRLTTFDLSSISVSKGFTSVLYGPNTLGGSINLVSRKPVEPLEMDMGVGINFDDSADLASRNAYINAGGNNTTWYWQGSASIVDRHFYSLPDDFSATQNEDGGRRENSENRDDKVSFKLGYTPNERDEYAISYQNSQGEKQTPLYAGADPSYRTRFWQWPEYNKESIYLIAKKGLGETEHVIFKAYYDTFENSLSSFDDASYTTQSKGYSFNSIYDDYSWGSSAEFATKALANHNIKFAAHIKTDVHREIDDNDSPEEYYQDQVYSFGGEDTFSVTDKLTLVSGISYDMLRGRKAEDVNVSYDLASDDALNGQLGLIYDINTDLMATASISHRSRFPTLKDRYSYRFGSAIPNAELESERATNIEVGLEGVVDYTFAPASLSWGLTVFHSKVTDAIEQVSIANTACTSAPCSQLQNIGEQENKGVEANISLAMGEHWEYHFNYTYLDRDNKSAPDIHPLDTPRNSLFNYLNYKPNTDWSFLASAEYSDKRYSATDASRIADDFIIGNLKASWTPNTHLTVEASVNNITDELYAYDEGFYEAGRNYLLTTRYKY